jgi:hypothetical protein
MRERGRYQIQLMKTRSSSGVGAKIDLGFDVDTLRIFDLGEDAEEAPTAGAGGSSSAIANALKRTNNTAPTSADAPDEGAPAPKIRAQTDSTKLRDFLNNLGE